MYSGYVDKVGTGTEDIVNLCKAEGLKTPEYHQEEDFRVVIWRSDPGAIQSDPGVIQSWWRLFTSQFVSILLFPGQNWLEGLRRAKRQVRKAINLLWEDVLYEVFVKMWQKMRNIIRGF